ncbi:MAG: hypothetical protein IPK26_26520 [Planctomycetes bacterium]|nr:hypothetical protein [Planctomycetota bacterium]
MTLRLLANENIHQQHGLAVVLRHRRERPDTHSAPAFIMLSAEESSVQARARCRLALSAPRGSKASARGMSAGFEIG